MQKKNNNSQQRGQKMNNNPFRNRFFYFCLKTIQTHSNLIIHLFLNNSSCNSEVLDRNSLQCDSKFIRSLFEIYSRFMKFVEEKGVENNPLIL